MTDSQMHLGNCADVMKSFAAESIDLTVTSPPYDDIREYKGYTFDFEAIARELWRITKNGGTIVWIVADATVDGSETGTSFKQALFFMSLGFKLHDTMIWNKGAFSAVGALRTRYAPVFEYMFIFCKGKLKTFNPIKDHQNVTAGSRVHGTIRQSDGSTRPVSKPGKQISELGQRYNVWEMPAHTAGNLEHPAPFPEQLANDHILSWSNPGATVLDPFSGSGTTGKMAVLNQRNFIGIEISEEYFEASKKRIARAQNGGIDTGEGSLFCAEEVS